MSILAGTRGVEEPPVDVGGTRMDLVQASIATIEEGQDPSGAYVACPTFPTYRYCWIRDGSFIALAMDASGRPPSARAFHRWVAGAVESHRGKVDALERGVPADPGDDDVLHARFALDGREGTEAWANFQLDGYGFWLSALSHHLDRTAGPAEEFLPAVRAVARYLELLWNRPCADCWEEFPARRHPTTVAAVAGGLRRAAGLLGDRSVTALADRIVRWIGERGVDPSGALTKFEGSDEVDASALFVLGPMGPFGAGDPVVTATLHRIGRELLVGDGGVYRYRGDQFYGGGLWVPLSGALAWIQALRGDRRTVPKILRWIEDAADPRGELPEQVSRRLLAPDAFDPWVDRWGPVARPLLWSHAMYLIAARAAVRSHERAAGEDRPGGEG